MTVDAVSLRASLVRLLLASSLLGALAAESSAAKATFPRLMGMNIGAKHYEDTRYQQDLARLDVIILGFYRGWQPQGFAATPTLAMRRVVRQIKVLNPAILVGQYTVMNEVFDDPADVATADLRAKLDEQKWWLRNSKGDKVQWTNAYGSWDTNFTHWAPPDAQGRRWPQWLAERNYSVYFRDIPEFDLVYLDNVMVQSRVRGDWRLDGRNAQPDDPDILSAHREGHVQHWRRIRELQPKALLIGNADNDLSSKQWRNQLNGAFLEGLMGETWSIERREGWASMMQRYRSAMRNTRPPHIVGFNVFGAIDDYRFLRYAYTSCLLDDGYFSFTDKTRGFSSVPWFDEYDHHLGHALSAPPTAAWADGIWRRDFEHGIVLVNPSSLSRTVTLGPGLRRLAGKQDSGANNGSPVERLTLRPQDGIVLRR